MENARYRKNAIMAYFFYVAVFYAILIFNIEPFVSHAATFGLIGNILAFPMYWLGLKIHHGDRRWPWIWFALTGLLYFIGDLLWAYNEDYLGVAPESPSLCYLFYLLNSYTCCCAFICYIRQTKNVDSGSIFLDVFVSILALGGLLYRFILQPLIADESVNLFTMFFHANMSVIDLALFTGILMIIFGTAHSSFYTKRTLLLGLSFFACCFVEQLSLAIEIYELPVATLFSPFWTVPFWLFALTATYPDEDETEEQEITLLHKRLGQTIDYLQKVIPYILALIILILVGPEAIREDFVFSLVFLLLFVRILKIIVVHTCRRRTCESKVA